MKTVAYTEHAPHFHEERWLVRACTYYPEPYGEIAYEEIGEYGTHDEAMAAAQSQPVKSYDTHLVLEPGHWQPDDMGDGLIDALWVDHDGHPDTVILWPDVETGEWDVEVQ